MIPKLLEEYDGEFGREATISVIGEKLSMLRFTYEVLYAMDGKIIGKYETPLLEAARVTAKRWVKKGELTGETK